uniref:mdm2-binding protein isoform X1 n=2 Tax=Oncorhynchus gorbuscha TaxID=8017 RepID=UPI001EAEB70D|nr:mdm2-binding protein isoform X1 [Oncorhynchus gorbuscha]
MDRYVLVVSFHQEEDKCAKALEAAKQIYDKLGSIASCNSKRRVSLFPACSLSGGPASQRWYFAVQTCHGTSQFCSTEWEELGSCQKNDEQEERPSTMEACLSALDEQEEKSDQPDPQQTQLYEEAAEGLHLLSDQLPPPGKALLDVIFLGFAEEAPKLKDFLPVIGSLKHMQTWHTAKMTIVTEHQAGWQKPASNLSARVVHPSSIMTCIDERELWRGGVLIREKKFASEVRFEGFSLRAQDRETWYSLLPSDPGSHNNSDHKLHSETNSDHNLQSEVFHYFRSVLDLVQLVTVSDIPSFLRSSTEFHLELSSKSLRDERLLDQFRSLSGKVGALFSLSCTVSSMALPPASQLSSQKWKDFMAKRPKTLPVPYVEVKGESGHHFLLVQGSEGGGCKARMIHSANRINGAAAMATVNGLLKENSVSSSVSTTTDWLRSLPCLHGDQLLQRERKLAEVQTLVLKECLRRREEAEKPASIPVNDLKILLSLAREQYLKMHDSTLPKASTLPKDSSLPRVEPCGAEEVNLTTKTTEFIKHSQHADWPERSVLQNYENLQRTRQKLRFGLLSGSSSDCLLGPKDVQGQRTTPALLDAKELLRHFTPDGLPTGDLQPLLVQRLGGNTFQMSPDLTPRKVTQIPFSQAASSHYHGLEFCLDEQGHKALDRDQGFVRLQSRLIRYETQTTCSKEPCPVPFALSPAPSPAVLSEPGSVPDGEALLNSDLPRIKRRSWDTDATHPHKRLAKSESSESLGSVCSGSSGTDTHPAVRGLRLQKTRSQSSSSSVSALRMGPRGPEKHHPDPQNSHRAPQAQGQAEDKASKESRSQKHARMLEEVVAKTLKHHGITGEHENLAACSQRLFEISKFYLKDLKTSRGLHEEMMKAASSNAKQVIDWVTERASK